MGASWTRPQQRAMGRGASVVARGRRWREVLGPVAEGRAGDLARRIGEPVGKGDGFGGEQSGHDIGRTGPGAGIMLEASGKGKTQEISGRHGRVHRNWAWCGEGAR